MKRAVVSFMVVASLLLSSTAPAQEPAAELDRDKAVRYARALEQQPLDPMAPQMRSWLMRWLVQTREVTVLVCDILGPIPKKDVHFGPELLVQYMAGNAVFQLQNPESKTDPVKPQLAGLASMLLAYEVVLQANPAARIPLYDSWIAKQAKGVLEAEREAAIRGHCSEPSTSSQASAADAPKVAAVGTKAPFLGGFLRETRILYPLKLGNWEAQNEKRYDDVSDGVSVRYSSEAETAGWLDLFVYPMGTVTPEQVLGIAQRERESLILTWLKGSKSKDKDISELRSLQLATGPSDLDGKASPVTAYSVDLAYKSGEARLNSAMVVLFHQLYMVKARFSVKEEAHTRSQVRESLERFATELLPRLTIASTGACWMPLPVEHLADGAKAPVGHTLAVEEGGVGIVYLYRDRILARDPAGPAVDMAMRMGLELQGRLYSGCNGAEPMNPNVPEGMREIRIEYRAPADSPPPADRLRSSQRAVG
ncbi:hypothetical protein DT603_10785 [Pseudoxanthomonas gei]|uniref:Uncharacterized protein n=1 Tax=Pseudoxanthomonas gei TaxID=1383030 RepID=A0ABX0ACN6_9GAMM|nr:hypothetical protein [Pseudoxanthomonas gei]NDK39327.1 hypothetical protein [Pseudoxanthomonas gei]